jgi:hypothetical protein
MALPSGGAICFYMLLFPINGIGKLTGTAFAYSLQLVAFSSL